MSNDENNIIDVEAVELANERRLPAAFPDTHRSGNPIEADRDWPHGPTADRRCIAHRKNGDQCKNAAIKGGRVCRFHGGAAKHVKAAARTRLENAAELMAKQLLGIALSADSEAVKLAAVKDALDRAGLRPPAEVVVSQGETKPYEEIFAGISTCSRAESRSNRGLNGDDDWFSSAASTDDVETQWDPSTESGISVPPYDERPPAPSTGTPEFDPPGRNQPPIHITGDDAVRAANAANRAIGAMPDQRAIESPHRRYPHP